MRVGYGGERARTIQSLKAPCRIVRVGAGGPCVRRACAPLESNGGVGVEKRGAPHTAFGPRVYTPLSLNPNALHAPRLFTYRGERRALDLVGR